MYLTRRIQLDGFFSCSLLPPTCPIRTKTGTVWRLLLACVADPAITSDAIFDKLCSCLAVVVIEFVFLGLLLLELALKLYTYGFRDFFQVNWNRFDFAITLLAIVGSALEAAVPRASLPQVHRLIDLLIVIRVLRVLKVIAMVSWFRDVIDVVFNFWRSIAVHFLLLFVFFYPFSIVGMQIFAGRYNETSCIDDVHLNATEFARLGYCSINFNNAPLAWLFLYHLLLLNQWHVLTEGLVAVTSRWARLFTAAFVLVFAFVLINVIIAFIIEAFLFAKQSRPCKFADALQSKIDDITNNDVTDAQPEERPDAVMVGKRGERSVDDFCTHMVQHRFENARSSP